LPDVLIPIGPDVQLLYVDLVADLRAGTDRPELDARLTDLIGLLVGQVGKLSEVEGELERLPE